MSYRPRPSAFTLVELIVVITILAILATVGFLALQGYTKDAKDSATKTNVRTVAQAVELESAAGGASIRRFASFSGSLAMSGKVLGAVLSGGTLGTTGTNYTPGSVDFAALKLDGSKFAADGSSYLMSAVDVPEKLVTGKTRNRTYFQIAALAGTSAYLEGTFSSALAASGSGTTTETTVTGIIANPNAGTGGTVALSSNLDSPVAGGSSSGGPAPFVCWVSTMSDNDGNSYPTVIVGSKCWMNENLRTTKKPDGSSISKWPAAHAGGGWSSDAGYYGCPGNAANNGEDCAAAAPHGMLYQWSAVMNGSTVEGVRGICPSSWHVPSDSEWSAFEVALGCGDPSWTAWRCSGLGDTMRASYAGYPIWFRHSSTPDGGYVLRGTNVVFWTSSQVGGWAWRRYLDVSYGGVARDSWVPKNLGFSVRCVKD